MRKNVPDISEFVNSVREIVSSIPEGSVLTYGDVAALAGFPSHSRLVGKILGSIGMAGEVPCHRVVNASGRPAPHWHSQKILLEHEGIVFKPNGCVDMKKFRWDIKEEYPDFN